MDFGKLSSIEQVDFTLPTDHPDTEQVWAHAGSSHTPTQVYVGLPVWSTKEWVGKWYPASAKDKDYLYYYSRQFTTIELNTTHYRIPDAATINRWYTTADQGFTFCPKWPQIISHDAMLHHVAAESNAFCEAILGLKEKLGVSFLQLPPSFSSQFHRVLEAFIQNMTPKVPLAIEFRHPDWFIPTPEVEQTFAFLRNNGVGTVITDVSGRRDVLHMHLTTPVATVRFVGNALHATDYQRINDWVVRIQEWMQKGLTQLFFFIHEPDPNTLAPELAAYLVERLNAVCGIRMTGPKPIPQVIQGSLFGS